MSSGGARQDTCRVTYLDEYEGPRFPYPAFLESLFPEGAMWYFGRTFFAIVVQEGSDTSR